MRSKLGISMMILGAVLVILALSLAVYNIYTDKAAGERSFETLESLRSVIEENSEAAAETTESNYRFSETVRSDESVPAEYRDGSSILEKSADPVVINSASYIGIITMPELGLELPVIESWSYNNLRIAPCRFTGDPENGGFIIAAHNYNSHFGRIKNLTEGSRVYFTDTNGKRYSYVVSAIELIGGGSPEKMVAGNWDLSLFTCTFDGSERVTVRCVRE